MLRMSKRESTRYRFNWKAAREAFDRDPPGLFPMEWRMMALLDPRIVTPTFGRYMRLEYLPSWEVREEVPGRRSGAVTGRDLA